MFTVFSNISQQLPVTAVAPSAWHSLLVWYVFAVNTKVHNLRYEIAIAFLQVW